jgi:hypothetical protein
MLGFVTQEQPNALRIDYNSKEFLNLHKSFPVLTLVVKKVCVGCGVEKPLEEFSLQKLGKLGRRSRCKDCISQERSAYLLENLDSERAKKRSYAAAHKEQGRLRGKRFRESNPDRRLAIRKKSEDKCRASRNERNRFRTKTDIAFRLRKAIRGRVNKWVKGIGKAGSGVKDIGCTMEFFKGYIESKFLPGMSWDNYGLRGWHIDHIEPLINFDPTDRGQFLKACHYTNLQPLWWLENLSKGSK